MQRVNYYFCRRVPPALPLHHRLPQADAVFFGIPDDGDKPDTIYLSPRHQDLAAQILHLRDYLVDVLDQHEVFDILGHLPPIHSAPVHRAFLCRPGADVLVLQRCCTRRVEGIVRFDLPPNENIRENSKRRSASGSSNPLPLMRRRREKTCSP